MENIRLKRKLFLVQLVLLLFIPAFLGVVSNYMVQRMTQSQLRWMFICYGWETVLFSFALVFPYLWAKPIEEFCLSVRQGKEVEEKEILRIQRLTFNYPLKIVLLVVPLSMFAYTWGEYS